MVGNRRGSCPKEVSRPSLRFQLCDTGKHKANGALVQEGSNGAPLEVQIFRLQLGWMLCTPLDSFPRESIVHLLKVSHRLIVLDKGRYGARAYRVYILETFTPRHRV